MAARPGQQAVAGPQYSLPKFTAEEQWVQKKQGEFIQGDVRMLSGIDVEKPFQNVQDAVQRLLPFHLFGAVDAADADLDDTPDCGGADLMSNRHEAWQELCISKANDLRKRADNSAAQIAALEKQIEAEALSGSRPLDRLAMVKLQQEDLKRKVNAEKAALLQLAPPAAAKQQQVAAVVAAKAGAGAGSSGSVGAPSAAAQVMVNPAAAQQLGMQQQLVLQQQLAAQRAAIQHLPPAQQQLLQQQLLQQQLQQQRQYAYLLQQQQIMQQQQLLQQAKKQ